MPITIFQDLPWYYVEMLDWKVENGVVKAFPKRKLSETAHREIVRAFRRWGGKYVRHNGVAYYELVLFKPSSASTKTARDMKKAYAELQEGS